MKASNALLKLKDAAPDATVFVLVGGRYVRVDDIVLSAVDATITGPTSVCLRGETFFAESHVVAEIEAAVARVKEKIQELSETMSGQSYADGFREQS